MITNFRNTEDLYMEQQIKKLLKRLAFLGYGSFEIKSIFRYAAGSECLDEMSHSQLSEVKAYLEKYEQLGSNFVAGYSK
jgi:hypothetical protein